MANIIGQNLDPYVINQIEARQNIQGSGVDGYRSEKQISYLNTRNAWVKLASGVSVKDPALSNLNLTGISPGMDLAKNHVLFGGSSKLASSGETLIQRETFVEGDFNVYENSEYGLVPMPGIISVNVQTLNRGSIKKATVRLRANNKKQFDIIDVLYLRLGYTVLLEWGNNKFISGNTVKTIDVTLIEDSVRFFSSAYENNKSYIDILGPINYYRDKYEGNYDALLGKISNFNWSFNPDGSYDIEITLISMGDVIESLKLNISTDRELTAFVLNASSGQDTSTVEDGTEEDAETPDILEENKDANLIASMLWTWKWVNRDKLNYETYEDSLYIDLPDTSNPKKLEPKFVGAFLEPTQGTVTATTRTYEFYALSDAPIPNTSKTLDEGGYGPVTKTFDAKTGPKDAAAEQQKLQQKLEKNDKDVITISSESSRGGTIYTYYDVTVGYKRLKQTVSSAESPLTNFGKEDACFLITNPQKQFYLRLGALLEFIEDNVMPKINTDESNHNKKPPLINIDIDPSYGPYKNWMYSLPNQVSLDPRVCIVRNDVFKKQVGTAKVYSNLRPFRAVDYRSDLNPNKAYITNIYLNFNFIIDTLNNNTDEKGNVSVYDFLKATCDSLNTALGGINNLEPVIDETSNTLKIIDSTPIPNTVGGKNYTLQLFGYNGSESTFVRKIDLKTAITPEYAAMVTVGATAGGYVKGTEGTAFSKWNKGLTDRFKNKLIPGNGSSLGEGDQNEAIYNYSNKFLGPAQSNGLCYGFSGNLRAEEGEKKNLAINPDAIASNISVVTEYYKYLIASKQNESGGSIGFVPFKLNFTMDGLAGIKIYNVLHIDTRFLPKAYGESLNFIVTGVSHEIKDNDWETNIETTVIPKTSGGGGGEYALITSQDVKEDIQTANTPPTNEEIGYPLSETDKRLVEKAGGIPPYVLLPNGQIKVKTWPSNLRPGDPGYNPEARHWFVPNPDYPLVDVKIPYGNKEGTVKVHPDFAPKIEAAIKTIKENNLQQYIKSVDSGFALRNVTNGVRLSNHAFGFAIDLNVNTPGHGWNQGFILGDKKTNSKIILSRKPYKTRLMQKQEFGFWRVARSFSFQGIGWYYSIDAMHFSINEGLETDIPKVPTK
jgi:hypothetical protein